MKGEKSSYNTNLSADAKLIIALFKTEKEDESLAGENDSIESSESEVKL